MNHVKGGISHLPNCATVEKYLCNCAVTQNKTRNEILECTKLNKSVGIVVHLFSLYIQVKIFLECYLYPYPMNYLPFIRSHLANGRFSRLLHYLKDISTIKNLSKFNLNREKLKKKLRQTKTTCG